MFFWKKPDFGSLHHVDGQHIEGGMIVASGSETLYDNCTFKDVAVKVEPGTRCLFQDCVFVDCDISVPEKAFLRCRILVSDEAAG